jgi:NADH dehydrogenase FAD-containing subunit
MSVAPNSRVVIIGAGSAANFVATKILKSKCGASVTIVSANTYYEDPVISTYLLQRPELHAARADKQIGSVVDVDRISAKGATYVFGVVTSIDAKDKTVAIEGAPPVPFDTLVVCVGVKYPVIIGEPGQSKEARMAFVQSWAPKVKAAKSILLGGGGPVSCDVAGELRAINPTAKIQMVCPSGKAMSAWSGTARSKTDAYLKKVGIQVIADSCAQEEHSLEKSTIALGSGATVEADIYIPFFGRGRAGFVGESIAGAANDRGRVVTNEYLQSTVLDSMFAVGCNSTVSNSHQANIEKEADTVAKNVIQRCRSEAVTNKAGKMPMDGAVYMHFGLGNYGVMNMPGCGGVMTRICGCCGICPCCGCCGWCCMYPASKIQSEMIRKMVGEKKGGAIPLHAPDATVMQR